uniref:Protein kinase domain-containing protein n=1 Tax=Oryza rufipogon TaxID=4529 RepID=A0A0E0NMJ2_ORYRU
MLIVSIFDIDECQHLDKYPCHGVCTNLLGGYKTKQRFFEQNGGVILQQQMHSGGGTGGFKIFSTEELEKATNNSAADRVLGHGGHGVVYKGVLEDNMVVAIKKSKMMEEAQTKEFAREMFILSQINHRNVVKLLGCCLEVEVPMLVYEFVSNGTLYHYIHGKEPTTDIALDNRLRIAAKSAEALAYMHSSASPPILHGDVKTANILLDDKLNAKVSDFGASKLAPTDEAAIATLVQGTCGYLDPEYLMTCQLTDKSDVYSFGVVVLELLTRKKALYLDGPEEDRSLVSRFTTAVKAGRHRELMDSQVRKEMNDEMATEIADLLMRCLSMNGEERPTMKEVAERLEMLRRYQQHPWAEAKGNAEENQSLLGIEHQNPNYQFRQHDVIDLEEGSMALAPATPASAQPLPGCPDKCGNISIPYPFGIGAVCARDFNFRLECNHAYSPPRLFVSEVELVSLSLDGEARALINARNDCSGRTTYINFDALRKDTLSDVSFGRSTAYRFSAARNRFVVLGCPVLGYLVDAEEYYVSGCISMCRKSQAGDDHLSSRCTGERGCCQNTIPRPLNFYKPYILSLNKSAEENRVEPIYHRLNSTACNYVFLVEDKWIDTTYSYRAYFNRTDDFDVPVVLDWAIRNAGNCDIAVRNRTDYACRSAHSECFNASDGQGYRCRCSKGYEGNPYLDGGCKDIDECQRTKEYPCFGKCTNTIGSYTCECRPGTSGNATQENGCHPTDKFTLALKVVTGVSVGVFLLLFMLFWLYLGLQKRKLIRTKQRFFEQNGGVLLQQQMRSYGGTSGGAGGFKIFSKEELEKATNSFAADRVLGRGGYGIVYKGVLEDNMVVAIKKSKMIEEAQTKEFAKEMCILSQINHKNVVKLLGCCLEVEVPMLVYEFVSNGTLDHYIHGGTLNTVISLDSRLRIAAESAEALSYMHSSASPPILHGDVKTANILLDDKLTAKVSDFGTSKLVPNDEFEIATLVQGTCGYLDPEYLMTCQLTDKSDVYSFGVVLLELLTRKKALYFGGSEEDRSLVSCFMTAVRDGRHEELIDSQVRNEMTEEVLQEITHLVMRCVSMSGEERPMMKEVAEKLEMLRRYQLHPWDKGDANPEEKQSLLDMEQRNVDQKFRHHHDYDPENPACRS